MQIISRLILTDTKRRAMHWSHVLYSMVQIIYQTLPICPNRTCMWFDFGTFVEPVLVTLLDFQQDLVARVYILPMPCDGAT